MNRAKRILAVASGGGHWIELLRLRPAFDGCSVTYVTVQRDYQDDVAGCRFHVVNDATRWSKIAVAMSALRMALIVFRERPDVVITTGAAPGYFAIRFGRMLGAKTIWLDSIANVDELSMGGQMAGRYATLWLTQWPHLAREGGPQFAGAVL
jgi:hypothetical protein